MSGKRKASKPLETSSVFERADSAAAETASKQLIKWFKRNGRSFPWRSERDPYAILIAEKLLQQTAARKVVVDAYQEILARFPNAILLSGANIRTLKAIVRPLGFVYRALELRALGRALVEEFEGTVPNELRKLMSLPGVGEYSARAVLSFAFDQDIPVVDTNVARFLYRYFGIEDSLPNNPSRKKWLIGLSQRFIPKGRSRDFNFAVLDLCAAICKPRRPLCEHCPINSHCASAFRFTGGSPERWTGSERLRLLQSSHKSRAAPGWRWGGKGEDGICE